MSTLPKIGKISLYKESRMMTTFQIICKEILYFSRLSKSKGIWWNLFEYTYNYWFPTVVLPDYSFKETSKPNLRIFIAGSQTLYFILQALYPTILSEFHQPGVITGPVLYYSDVLWVYTNSYFAGTLYNFIQLWYFFLKKE